MNTTPRGISSLINRFHSGRCLIYILLRLKKLRRPYLCWIFNILMKICPKLASKRCDANYSILRDSRAYGSHGGTMHRNPRGYHAWTLFSASTGLWRRTSLTHSATHAHTHTHETKRPHADEQFCRSWAEKSSQACDHNETQSPANNTDSLHDNSIGINLRVTSNNISSSVIIKRILRIRLRHHCTADSRTIIIIFSACLIHYQQFNYIASFQVTKERTIEAT